MVKVGFPLQRIGNFSKRQINILATFSITTAEEFISITNTREKQQRIASLLGIDQRGLQHKITLAKKCLPDDLRKEMEKPVDTSLFGLGALEPKPKNKNTQKYMKRR